MPAFALPVLYVAIALSGMLLFGTVITGNTGWLRLFDNLHWTISFTAAAVLGWIGVRASIDGERKARRWFALGLSAACLGQWIWNLEEYLRWTGLPAPYYYLQRLPVLGKLIDTTLNFPFSAFVSVWLGVGFIGGLFVAMREKLDRQRMRAALLDFASMTLLILSLVLAVYLPHGGKASPATLTIMTGFPLFMLSAVCLVALTVLHLRMRVEWPWICMLVGMGVLGFTWMEWNVLTLDKALSDGTLINALFTPPMLLLGFGAMGWRVRMDDGARFDGWCEDVLRMMPLLTIALAASSIFMVLAAADVPRGVYYTVIVSGVLILLLSALRQRLMLSEYRRLLNIERMAAESQARYEFLAKHDPLTQLPNRLHLNERLRQLVERVRGEKQGLTLLLIGIDHFKNVNDSYGHIVGDALLVSIVQRLLAFKRGGSILARLGSDELALVLRETVDRADVAAHAQGLLDALREPFMLSNGTEVFMSASIGISLYPDDANDAVQLIRNADTAMYEAKRSGRSLFHFYTHDLTAMVQERLAIGSHLHHALASGEFLLHYQPQVDQYGHVFSVEALLRWKRQGGNLIPPDQFIPLAEETGIIIPIGDWVLETACRQAQYWQRIGMPDLRIAVNVSARQLRGELVDTVAATLRDNGLHPSRLTIEITESAIMERELHAVSVLAALKKIGVTISIDDFGTGHSSLAKLRLLPVDELKIDKVFLRDLPEDSENAKIVSTIIAMAHSLNLDVLAEGVEHAEQVQFLARHGCVKYQGFHFDRPLTADAVTARLLAEAELRRSAVNTA